jgi:hypothetical protein
LDFAGWILVIDGKLNPTYGIEVPLLSLSCALLLCNILSFCYINYCYRVALSPFFNTLSLPLTVLSLGNSSTRPLFPRRKLGGELSAYMVYLADLSIVLVLVSGIYGLIWFLGEVHCDWTLDPLVRLLCEAAGKEKVLRSVD